MDLLTGAPIQLDGDVLHAVPLGSNGLSEVFGESITRTVALPGFAADASPILYAALAPAAPPEAATSLPVTLSFAVASCDQLAVFRGSCYDSLHPATAVAATPLKQ